MRSEVWLAKPWIPRQVRPCSAVGTGLLDVRSQTSDTVVLRKGPLPQDTACDSDSPVLAENNRMYELHHRQNTELYSQTMVCVRGQGVRELTPSLQGCTVNILNNI